MRNDDRDDEERLNNYSRKMYDDKDKKHFIRLESIVKKAGFTLKDIVRHFPSFIQRRDLPRLLAHYELFKLIVNLPGSIIELGVYRGSGLFTWSKLLESFTPSDRTRKVFGFDHFQGVTGYQKDVDGDLEPWLKHVLGDLASDKEVIQELVQLHNDDNLLPGVERCQIIVGDVTKTVPLFQKNHPGVRLSMLYFDMGLFEPTISGLRHFYDLVVPGGLVVFNGYGMPPWEGETLAVNQFFHERNIVQPIMQKFDFSAVPHAYFKKI